MKKTSEHKKRLKMWAKNHAENCSRKLAYATYDLALEAAIKYRKKWGSFMQVYQCYHCGDYHIGHR